MTRLLVTGGCLRPNGYELGEGKYYDHAKLLELDLDSGEFKELISFDNVNENYPAETPNIQFTSGYVDGPSLWLPTDTEIHLYNYPSMELIKRFSHPFFQNLHSVTRRGDLLYVTSTGLDVVASLDKDTGEVVEIFNTHETDVWDRFSREVDYRLVHSTRPHFSHPNYVFWIGDTPWVTRCTQDDAACLTDLSKTIKVTDPKKELSVHDGLVIGDLIYFTAVDGSIVIADATQYNVIDTIKIYEMAGFKWVRGWARGLFIKDNIAYIGFSKLRKTKNIKKLEWLLSLNGKHEYLNRCSILAVDLEKRAIIKDYLIPENMIDSIYSVLRQPS